MHETLFRYFCIRMSSEYKFTMTLVTYKGDGANRCVDKTVGVYMYVLCIDCELVLFFAIYILYVFIYLFTGKNDSIA